MKSKKSFNIRMLVVISALVLLIVSLVCYNSFNTNAGLSQRSYLRYDYKNPSNAPYQYTISVPETVFNNDVQPYSIIGSNDMVRDYDTSVVRLSVGGTGFIIGEHTIVTAGHCVYNSDRFIDFTIDIVGNNNNTIKTINPRYVHVPKKYADSTSDKNNYDYALIYVEEDLSEYGMFKMGICLDQYINDKGKVIVSGFPQVYPDGYEGSEYGLRFKASGNITSVQTDGLRLSYNADTSNGDSGGPVYVNESYVNIDVNDKFHSIKYDYNTVIAIHTHGGNSGVRINFDILQFCYQNVHLTN